MRRPITAIRTTTITLGVVLALGLAGCTASANLTVPAEKVAELAAQALGKQWQTEPTVDCGDDSVDAVEGTEVECVASNPKSGLDYPATVTITKVDGAKFTIGVETGSAIVEDDADAAAPEAPAGSPSVPAASLATLASGALAAELGYEPVIDCGTEPLTIFVDAEFECEATGDDGLVYPAHIVVTEVSATNYNIDVAMGAEPIE